MDHESYEDNIEKEMVTPGAHVNSDVKESAQTS